MGTTSAAKKRGMEFHFGENSRHGFGYFNGERLARDGKPVPHINDKQQRERFPERKPKVAKDKAVTKEAIQNMVLKEG